MAREPKAIEHSKSCLEDSTERSESNPGRSLGIITSSKKELSGRQYHDLNKHPCQSVESVFENPLRYKSNTDLSDSTDASLGGRYCLPD